MAIKLALVKWRDTLLKKLQDNVTKAAIKLIRRERCGETINSSFVICVRDSYGKHSHNASDVTYSLGEIASVFKQIVEVCMIHVICLEFFENL